MRKLGSQAENSGFDIVEQKDLKIQQLIEEGGMQDLLREELEVVQEKL